MWLEAKSFYILFDSLNSHLHPLKKTSEMQKLLNIECYKPITVQSSSLVLYVLPNYSMQLIRNEDKFCETCITINLGKVKTRA